MSNKINIEDLVSPSDQKLLELAGGLVEDMGLVADIFKDRNCEDVSTSFMLGIAATLIYRTCNISVDNVDFIKFLAEQAKKDGLD